MTSGIIDTHVHLALDEGMKMVGHPHGPTEYAANARQAGVGTACVLAMAPRDDHERTVEQNNLVLTAEVDGIVALPFCSVHPADGAWALSEINRVARAGARGLKLHPNTQRFDVADPAVADVVRRAGEHHLPVLFDAYSLTDAGQLGKYLELAVGCPDSELILAHLGGSRFADMFMFAIADKYPWWGRRVWFDLSATVPWFADSPFAEQLLWTCRQLGGDRLLFGSDYPLMDVGESLTGVHTLGFTDTELDAITHDNAAALLHLD